MTDIAGRPTCRQQEQQTQCGAVTAPRGQLLDEQPDHEGRRREEHRVLGPRDQVDVPDVAGDDGGDNRLNRDRVEKQHRQETAVEVPDELASRTVGVCLLVGQRRHGVEELHLEQCHHREQCQVGHDDDDHLHPRPGGALAVDVVLVLRGGRSRREHLLNLTGCLLCLADEFDRPGESRDVVVVVELPKRRLETRSVVDLRVHLLELVREFPRGGVSNDADGFEQRHPGVVCAREFPEILREVTQNGPPRADVPLVEDRQRQQVDVDRHVDPEEGAPQDLVFHPPQ